MRGLTASGAPRGRPRPFDAVLTFNSVTTRVMLMGGKNGAKLVQAVHPNPMGQTTPTEFNYSAQNPEIESTQSYHDLHLGFGQGMQVGFDDRRYRAASGVDCSIAGKIFLGPRLSTITPGTVDATTGITHFFEVAGGLYALNGRYVQKRTDDTDWNTGRQDFGAGNAALDVVVTAQNAASPTTYAYIALGDAAGDFLYRFDGTTYTQHGSLFARAFAVVGRELYRAHDTNSLSKVDTNADPWTAGNWAAANLFKIGDKTSAITRMVVNAAGLLLIFKTDGIYALDENGQDIQLYSDLKPVPDSSNGFYHFKFENWVHVTYSGRHFRIDPTLALEPIGPERFMSNDSVVRGSITAGVGTAFAAYAGMYDVDSTDSYLMKFGAYDLRSDNDPERVDAWHGSLSEIDGTAPPSSTNPFGSRKITAMHRSTIGAPSGHERLYIGCSDGSIFWMILPCVPDPTACSQYQYGTGAAARKGLLQLPYWHGGFMRDEKVLRAATITGTKLDANYSAQILYIRTAGNTGNYGAYPTSGELAADSVPGERFPLSHTRTLADIVLKIGVTNVAAATDTPIVTGVALHYAINPPLQLIYELVILAEDGLVNQQGVPLRMGADQIRENIQTARTHTAGGAVWLPDGTTGLFQLRNYREEIRWDETARRHRSVIVVDAVQSDAGVGGGVTTAAVLT